MPEDELLVGEACAGERVSRMKRWRRERSWLVGGGGDRLWIGGAVPMVGL